MNAIISIIGVLIFAYLAYRLGVVNGYSLGSLKLKESVKQVENMYLGTMKIYYNNNLQIFKEFKRILNDEIITETNKQELIKMIDTYLETEKIVN